jgi:rhodanese-related sulfurtransferase
MSNRVLASLMSFAVAVTGLAPRPARAQGLPTTSFGEGPPNVSQGVLGTPGQKTAELSTEEMKHALADRSVVVLDARPFREFAISHIPGALNVAAKPGVAMSMYVCLKHIAANDRTAVFIDTREPAAFVAGSLPGARNLPRNGVLEGKDVGEVKKAKDDGRLPMEDHNTRLVVIGGGAAEARFVAEAIAREAFHNVSYFPGTLEEARAALGP